jgi:hypothetical protein
MRFNRSLIIYIEIIFEVIKHHIMLHYQEIVINFTTQLNENYYEIQNDEMVHFKLVG